MWERMLTKRLNESNPVCGQLALASVSPLKQPTPTAIDTIPHHHHALLHHPIGICLFEM